MERVTITQYAGPNSARVEVGPVVVYFSYSTPVAFFDCDSSLIVRMNDVEPPAPQVYGEKRKRRGTATTGRHLNEIDGGAATAKAARLPGPQFNAALAEYVNYLNGITQ